jgi:hypothetical protein
MKARDAYERSYQALALARLINEGMSQFEFTTDRQRAVGDGMDLLIQQLDELGDWLGDEAGPAEAAPVVAAKTVKRRKK